VQRYFIQLSYNGTAYHGWQVQKNAALTVQQVINEMLTKLLQEPISIMGCGRTDAGVHAKHYFAHFDAKKELLENKAKWLFKFNHALPDDIVIHDVIAMDEIANARFDAVARTYQYFICRTKNAFQINTAYFFYGDLNIDAMNEAAKVLFDYEDFSSFARSNTQTSTNICKLYKAEWTEEGEVLVFTISANRFLRNMVRAIVGTLLKVGKDKMTIDEFRKVIESKDRKQAGLSALACGLYLTKVEYPKNYFNEQGK
jgi:tRNA pseudouridine38-40 synthase